ncbi:hypothetical protein Tco_1307668, partial [Tanacetum coccineum]
MNQKLLRSLSLEWNTHAVVWMNKPKLEIMSMDDLYNNLKVYEPEVKRTSSSNTSTQNMAFMPSNNFGSTNKAVNIAHGVSAASIQVSAANLTTIDNLSDAVICAFFASQLNSSQLDNEDLQQIMHSWPTHLQILILRFTVCRRNLEFYKKNEFVYVEKINGLKWDIQVGEITIGELRKKLEIVQKEESQIVDNCKKGLGYNAVSPPLTGNFLPPKHDLSGLDEFVNKPIVNEPIVKKSVVETSEAKASANKPKVVRKNNGAPIMEDWVSDSEEEDMPQAKKEKKTVKSSFAKIKFVKSKEQVKSHRKTTVKQ